MKIFKTILTGIIITGCAMTLNSCGEVRETEKADLSADKNEPMRDRYTDTKRDNTPGHQNRENELKQQ